MLNHQKNTLLALLAQFEVKLYTDTTPVNETYRSIWCKKLKVINDNLTSIKKQIKML